MNATLNAKVSTAAAPHPCECGRFQVEQVDGKWLTVPCGGTTKRVFAPGHDARLKGFLIRAEVAGLRVRRTGEGNNPVQTGLYWAKSFGFGHQVAQGVQLAKEKAATKKAPKVEVVKFVKAKVGRWTYDGEVKDNTFTYLNNKGDKVSTTKFTVV